jgi:acyl-CoA synthetase (AMP-forming)/AMP-acid ligase II
VESGELDMQALQDHAARQLARNRLPREWAIVDALPLGPSRKVLKRELREQIRSGALPTSTRSLSGGSGRDPGQQNPPHDKE